MQCSDLDLREAAIRMAKWVQDHDRRKAEKRFLLKTRKECLKHLFSAREIRNQRPGMGKRVADCRVGLGDVKAGLRAGGNDSLTWRVLNRKLRHLGNEVA